MTRLSVYGVALAFFIAGMSWMISNPLALSRESRLCTTQDPRIYQPREDGIETAHRVAKCSPKGSKGSFVLGLWLMIFLRLPSTCQTEVVPAPGDDAFPGRAVGGNIHRHVAQAELGKGDTLLSQRIETLTMNFAIQRRQ